jgi:ribosomal protein S4
VYLNIIKNNDKKNKKSIYLDFKYYYHEFFFKLFCEEKQFSYYKKRRLIYKFEAPKFYNKGRKLNKRFISLRLTRLYFLTYKDCQFRKLFRKAAKMNGQFQLNYLKFLECRILSVLYRFNFHYDIFFLLKLIRKGNNVFINFNLVNHPNKILLVGDFLTISKKFHAKFRSI